MARPNLLGAIDPLLTLRPGSSAGAAQQQQPQSQQAVGQSLLGGITGMTAVAPAASQQKRNLAGMFGVDVRSPIEKINDQLAQAGVNMNTSAGQLQAARLAQQAGLSQQALQLTASATELQKKEQEEGRAELARTEARQQRVGQLQFIDASSLSAEKKAALKTSAGQGGFPAFKNLTDAMGLEEWKAVGGSSNAVVNNQTGEIRTVDTGQTLSAQELLDRTVAGTVDMDNIDQKSMLRAMTEVQKLIDSEETLTAADIQEIANKTLLPKLSDSSGDQYVETQDVDGNMRFVRAPTVGSERYEDVRSTAVANLEAIENTINSGENVLSTLDRTLEAVEGNENFYGGLPNWVLSKIPDTDEYDVAKLVTAIKANIGFDRLSRMRRESPTGGALGQVSNLEIGLLQSAIANLEGSQSKQQFIDNLKIVKTHYANLVADQKNRQKTMPDIETMMDYSLGYINDGYRVFSKNSKLAENETQPTNDGLAAAAFGLEE